MKKTVLLLLLVSFCGGTAESGLVTSENVSVDANEVTPEVKNENDQEQVESKETLDEETTTSTVNEEELSLIHI